MARTPIMAGNWKMNLDHVEATGLVQKLAWTLDDLKYDASKSEAAVLRGWHVGQYFDAFVTGVGTDGVWVRVFAPPAEGKLVQGNESLRVGEMVRVKLVATSVEHGFIDFALQARARHG